MATNTPVNISSLISSTPGVAGGRPRLAGSGVSVRAVAARHRQGERAEEMLEDWPHLDLARIYAALAYYHANKVQIDEELEAEAALYDKLAARSATKARARK
jgi:uncharacterized protein (DUF433 family)